MRLERRVVKRQSGVMVVIDAPNDARPVQAALLAVVGMGIIGVVDNVMPEIADHIGMAQFHVVRSAMSLCVIGAILVASGQSFLPVNPWGVLGRSILITIGMGLYFACVGFLPVAQCLAGVFTAPLWVMVVNRLRGRRTDAITAALICVGFLGCLWVVQPNLEALSLLAIGPLAAGFFYGMGGLVTRRWTGQESVWMLTGAYLATMGVAALIWLGLQPADGTGYLSRGWAPMPGYVLTLCAVQAAAAVVAVAMLARAYQLAAPAFVGAFEYTVLIVAAGVGFAVWGHSLNAVAMLGVAIILATGAALAARGDRA